MNTTFSVSGLSWLIEYGLESTDNGTHLTCHVKQVLQYLFFKTDDKSNVSATNTHFDNLTTIQLANEPGLKCFFINMN